MKDISKSTLVGIAIGMGFVFGSLTGWFWGFVFGMLFR